MSQQESSDKKHLLEKYASFPFESDEAFQQGLTSVLEGDGAISASSQPEMKADIILRAKVFYFNKMMGSNIITDDVKALANVDEAQTVDTSEPFGEDETRVLTLVELKELIESGRTDRIPNNRHIPDKLNDGEPSQSTAIPRKKPWEIQAGGSDLQAS